MRLEVFFGVLYAIKKVFEAFYSVLEHFRANIPLSKLNSIDKVSETTKNRAVSLIKTYCQNWRIIEWFMGIAEYQRRARQKTAIV